MFDSGKRLMNWVGTACGTLAALVLLSSCGGGAPGPNGSTGPAPTASISVSLTDPTTGASRNTITATEGLLATATLLDASSQPLAGKTVQFTLKTTSGAAPIAVLAGTGSGLTDASGKLALKVDAASAFAQGTGTLVATATVDGNSLTAQVDFQVGSATGSPTLTLALTDSATGIARSTITSNASIKATAKLVDAGGAPIANAIVSFAFTNSTGSSSPLALFSASSGITDATGLASVIVSSASAAAQGTGTINVSATVGGATFTASAPYQVGSSKIQLILTDPLTGATSNTIRMGAPVIATATLVDAMGVPIANALVQFSLSSGGTTLAALTPSSGSGMTDLAGRVVISVSAASALAQGTGTLTANALLGGATLSTQTTFQVGASGSPSLTLLLTDPASGVTRTTVTAGLPVNAKATLRDATGQPIAGALVQVSFAALGVADSNIVVLSPQSGAGLTDASGSFTVTVFAASALAQGAGTLTATATVGGASKTAQANLQVGGASGMPSNITIALTNSSGQASTSLTYGAPLNATARLRDAAGLPIANALVQFTLTSPGADAPIATFTPASGTAVTDSTGSATVRLQAATIYAQGAGTITASATVGQTTINAASAYSVGAANIVFTSVTLTPPTINAFQTSQVSVVVSGVPSNLPVTVNFTSPCAMAGKASIEASAVTVNGVATATYTDKGCGTSDLITVSTLGATSVQRVLTIVPAAAAGLQFVSAAPMAISINGAGGISNALVTFKVVNALQLPMSGVAVTMSLSTSVSGVLLDGQTGSITKQSGVDGTVTVTVSAGSAPGPVRVSASALSGTLTAVSSQLTIQTGLPTQSRFSLSVETFNIEGLNVDGTMTAVTIRAADRVGNPVPDGTVVNFRSSGGAIQPSCQTIGGACSVNFISQANRPASGRVAVLAWAIGEESFTDLNGNNKYDAGEPFGDLGDAFVDANFSGVFEAGEEYIAYDPAATSACASPLAAASRPNSCDGKWGLAHVRASAQIVLSGSSPNPNVANSLPSQVTLWEDSGTGMVCKRDIPPIYLTLMDQNNNPMPAGTTITAKLSTADVTATVFGSPVASTTIMTGVGTSVVISLSASGCTGTKTATLSITITTPLGKSTALSTIPVYY